MVAADLANTPPFVLEGGGTAAGQVPVNPWRAQNYYDDLARRTLPQMQAQAASEVEEGSEGSGAPPTADEDRVIAAREWMQQFAQLGELLHMRVELAPPAGG